MSGHDAELRVVFSLNDTDLWRTDALIDPGLILISALEATTVTTASTAAAATPTAGPIPKATATADIVLLWACCTATCGCAGRWGR
jgi:hypothetical protein